MNNTAYEFVKFCSFGDSITFVVMHFPSNTYANFQIIFCVVSCLLMIPTVLLNGISVNTIFRSSQLSSKLCYFLVLVQSAIDLAVGLLSIPLYSSIRVTELLGTATCLSTFICETVAYLIFGFSLTILSVFTFERYTSIFHPHFHRSHLTKRRILIYNGCISIVVFMEPILRVASERVYEIAVTVGVLTFLFFHTYAYAKIFLVVRNMKFPRNEVGDCSTVQSSSTSERKKSRRNHKLAKSCALVVGISYLCYIPSVVCYIRYKHNLVNYRVTHFLCTIVIAVKSSLNCIVFFWRRPLLRGEALKVLRNIFSLDEFA